MEVEVQRVLLSFIVGYLLSVSGSLTQLITNNSLASPSTLGMDGVAVLFVIFSYFFSSFIDLSITSETLSFLLFLLSVTVFFIFQKILVKNKNVLIQSIWKHSSMKGVILIGLSFNLFVGAIFSIVQFLFMAMNVDFPNAIWFGNLRQYDDSWLYLFTLFFIITIGICYSISKKLDYLNIGTQFAKGLGVEIRSTQSICLLLSLVISGVVISYFGVFSFLGLIFPHLLRSISFFQKNMKHEIIYGAVVCGVIFSGIDFLCYTFTYQGAELPVGMVSSVLGSFFLIVVLFKSKYSLS